jgi:hypothetical protein
LDGDAYAQLLGADATALAARFPKTLSVYPAVLPADKIGYGALRDDLCMNEKSHTFRESTNPANMLAKAEGWLSSVVDHVEMAADQEALVYLRSRGREYHDQVTALVESWKKAEQARLDEYNRKITVLALPSGKKRSKKRDPEANVSNFEEISRIFLRDFWDATPLGEYSLDATMLRTVDWCGIAGFEQWWRRLAQSRKEMLLQGGMEEPVTAAYWLFNMARSDYAIQLMPRVLEGYLESISLAGPNKRQPWVFPGSAGLEEHLAYASALVFAQNRLSSDNVPAELVLQAVETICKHQIQNGGWRTLTGDADVSIESTAMALHALAVAQPRGWPRMAARAAEWLWSMQRDDGSWAEPAASGPVHLTVLVLDAIALANNDDKLTFRWSRAPQATPRPDGLGQAEAESGRHKGNLPAGSSRAVAPAAVNGIPVEKDRDIPDLSTSCLEAQVGTTAQQRRAAVDAYIDEVFLKTNRRITRKDFWTAARYKDSTEFERWQRDDPKTTRAARKAFDRILANKPHLK